ncbi:MAG TPA: hypothetical protein VGF56_12680 [Rhizomicrobium sp.]|jgi:hypothetical protein
MLIVCGLLTFSMIAMAVAPRALSRFIFGEEPANAASLLVARSWAAMVAASGLMLVYAAYHPQARLPILLYSIAGKGGFVLLVGANFARLRNRPAFPMALIDLAMVALFAWSLAAD